VFCHKLHVFVTVTTHGCPYVKEKKYRVFLNLVAKIFLAVDSVLNFAEKKFLQQ